MSTMTNVGRATICDKSRSYVGTPSARHFEGTESKILNETPILQTINTNAKTWPERARIVGLQSLQQSPRSRKQKPRTAAKTPTPPPLTKPAPSVDTLHLRASDFRHLPSLPFHATRFVSPRLPSFAPIVTCRRRLGFLRKTMFLQRATRFIVGGKREGAE